MPLLPAPRTAHPGDAAGIARCFAVSWSKAYTGLFPADYVEAMARRRDEAWWVKTLWRTRTERPLVLALDGEVAGFLQFGRNRYGAPVYEGEIYELYVDPAYQRRGIGRALLDAARGSLARDGIEGLMAWSIASNEPCGRFLEAMGGVLIGQSEVRFRTGVLPRLAYGWPPVGRAPTPVVPNSPEG
jgi:ribosomal protein S18 acetylase RimI-like enzyme